MSGTAFGKIYALTIDIVLHSTADDPRKTLSVSYFILLRIFAGDASARVGIELIAELVHWPASSIRVPFSGSAFEYLTFSFSS